MARSEARIQTSIWSDEAFLALPALAQRLYFLLLAQPGLSYCGVLPYRPRRWAQLAVDTSEGTVKKAVAALAGAGRFVVVDSATDELMVRTFVRHDGVLGQPNMIVAMAHDFLAIDSTALRSVVLEQLPEDFPAWFADAFPKGSKKGLPEGFLKAYAQWFADAHVRERAPAPSPTPIPQPPEGSKSEPAAPPPLAESLLREWYESREPRPLLAKNAWPGMRSTVQKALDNGYEPAVVRSALGSCDVVSAGWLEPQLRKAKAAAAPVSYQAPRTVYR